MTQALEFDDVAGGRKGEPRGRLVFTVEDFGEEHPGGGNEAATGHLLRITHQFIEVNFWGGDKSSDAAAALDDSFALQRGQRMARGHQADLMDFGEVALRGDGVAGMQLSSVDALADGALNSLVGGQAVAVLGGHSFSGSAFPIRGHVKPNLEQKTDVPRGFALENGCPSTVPETQTSVIERHPGSAIAC